MSILGMVDIYIKLYINWSILVANRALVDADFVEAVAPQGTGALLSRSRLYKISSSTFAVTLNRGSAHAITSRYCVFHPSSAAGNPGSLAITAESRFHAS